MTIEEVQIGPFEVQLRRTRRVKSLGIRIKQGQILVNAPQQLSLLQIRRVLLAKRVWIQEKLALQPKNNSPLEYKEGELIDFSGRQYRLTIVPGQHRLAQVIENELRLFLPRNQMQPRMIRNALIRWYQDQALHTLSSRVEHFKRLLKVSPAGIHIKTFKARWGSCSHLGVIDFNWHLMMAPPCVIDYVVVHELCHLIEFNHSKAFWYLVGTVLPDYPQHKLWLKQHGCFILDKMSKCS